jgi:hypothetical protein
MVAINFVDAKVHFLFEKTKKIADIFQNTCYFVIFYLFRELIFLFKGISVPFFLESDFSARD